MDISHPLDRVWAGLSGRKARFSGRMGFSSVFAGLFRVRRLKNLELQRPMSMRGTHAAGAVSLRCLLTRLQRHLTDIVGRYRWLVLRLRLRAGMDWAGSRQRGVTGNALQVQRQV